MKAYYAIIPANVRYSNVNEGAKLLYGEITALCNELGYCYASNAYFAKLYKLDRRTIRRWINQLIDQGFIRSEVSKRNTRKIYIDDGKNSGGGRTKMSQGVGQKCPRGMDKNVLPYNKNITINNTVYIHVFNFWNSKKIIVHRIISYYLEKIIDESLRNYSLEEIETSINNYSKILNSDKHYYSYKKTLADFLTKDVDTFLDWKLCNKNFSTTGIINPEKMPEPDVIEYCVKHHIFISIRNGHINGVSKQFTEHFNLPAEKIEGKIYYKMKKAG
jgi:hypothetical protein